MHSAEECIAVAKTEWLENLLAFIGIDVVELNTLSAGKAMEYLLLQQVDVYDYPALGALKVLYKGPDSRSAEVIGEWAGAEYKLKREDGKLFYEISVECWSIIDHGIDVS